MQNLTISRRVNWTKLLLCIWGGGVLLVSCIWRRPFPPVSVRPRPASGTHASTWASTLWLSPVVRSLCPSRRTQCCPGDFGLITSGKVLQSIHTRKKHNANARRLAVGVYTHPCSCPCAQFVLFWCRTPVWWFRFRWSRVSPRSRPPRCAVYSFSC